MLTTASKKVFRKGKPGSIKLQWNCQLRNAHLLESDIIVGGRNP